LSTIIFLITEFIGLKKKEFGMKEKLGFALLACFLVAFPAISLSGQKSIVSAVTWNDCLNQKAAWYGGDDARRIAENVLLYQRASGGWPKNIDMAATLDETQKAGIAGQRSQTDSNIDNGATYTQMIYLARVFNAANEARFKAAFLKGFEYLLNAQYENGGWPQYHPKLDGYYRRITFNDDAMIGVMELLREIARGDKAYAFVDAGRRARAEKAVEKGIDCILKCQIVVNGKRTAWCAQHDEKTFEPVPARSYEKISLSGSESVGIVRFLMGIERPSPQIIESIQSAVAWLNQVKLTGIKVIERPDPSLPKGFDKVVVEDLKAGPLWARFYEIATNRPIFSGRDGVIKDRLSEIEHERRIGYNWYTEAPHALLTKDYPAWSRRWASGGSR
jgi:PelA/Pel-15E family pectate lyase